MARQEKSLTVCLEMLQDYTAKDFSLFAVLTTADFYSHNSQFHFLSHNPNDMKQWHATLERHLKRNDQCDRKTQKKMSEKRATKRWRNENFPSAPGTANKFNSRLYDNKHQYNTDLVEIRGIDNFNIDFIESQFIQINGWHYTIVYIFLDLKVYYY